MDNKKRITLRFVSSFIFILNILLRWRKIWRMKYKRYQEMPNESAKYVARQKNGISYANYGAVADNDETMFF